MLKTILICLAVVFALFIVGAVGQRDLAGRPTAPPDWPLALIGAPEDSKDRYYGVSPRSPLQPLLLAGRKAGLVDEKASQKRGQWVVAFNMEGGQEVGFERLARPLERVGFYKLSEKRGDWKIERSYALSDGSMLVDIIYMDAPRATLGPARNPQQWIVRIERNDQAAGTTRLAQR